MRGKLNSYVANLSSLIERPLRRSVQGPDYYSTILVSTLRIHH